MMVRRFDMSDSWKSIWLSEDIGLRFVSFGRPPLDIVHCHFEIGLFIPELGGYFPLFESVYNESWKVHVFRLNKLEREMDAEDEREMNEIDIIRKHGYGVYEALKRKGAL
jgi:hypothetical protein